MNMPKEIRKRTFVSILLLLLLINPRVACVAADTWQRRMDDAAFYLVQRQTQFALQNYLGALNEAELSRNNPRLFLTALLLAEFYDDAKTYGAAEKYYHKAATIYPFEKTALAGLASIYSKAGRAADLAQITPRIKQSHKLDSDTDFGPFMADLQESAKQDWFAKHKAEQRARSTPTNTARVRFLILKNKTLGACCLSKSSGIRFMDQIAESSIIAATPVGSLPDIQSECVQVEFSFQSNRHANAEEAAAFRADDKEKSAKVLKEVTASLGDKNPTVVFYICEHARACMKNKDFDEATVLFRKAVKLAETKPSAGNSVSLANVGLADSLYASGNSKEAEECYLSALSKINPLNKVALADLYHGYGHLLYKLDRAAEGDAIFAKEKAIR